MAPSLPGFYYVGLLAIPTPRWTTFDHEFFGVALPTDVPASIQERAFCIANLVRRDAPAR